MGNIPIIQKISLTRYQFPFNDVGKDLSFAMGPFYQPGGKGLRVALEVWPKSGRKGLYSWQSMMGESGHPGRVI